MNDLEIKRGIENSLRSFASRPLADAATALYESLGYRSQRRIPLKPNIAESFVATFAKDKPLNADHALLVDWQSVDFLFQKDDGTRHTPERRVHRENFGNVTTLPSVEQAKLTHRAFFPEDVQAACFCQPTVLLDDLVYISTGLRPWLASRLKGESSSFVTEDLVSSTPDKAHTKKWIESKDLARWVVCRHAYLEWGTKRAPAQFESATFSALYEAPEKLLTKDISASAASEVAYDDKQCLPSHTAYCCVPWHSLHGVRNNSLKKAARYLGEKPLRHDLPQREELEKTSRRFSTKFLLAVMNSSAVRDFLRANRRSNLHLYPDDWKKLPIPDVGDKEQAPIIKLVDRILAAKQRDLEADTTEWEREIDRLVHELYGLTPDEIKLVDESARK